MAAPQRVHPEAEDGLALSIVSASNAPLLLLAEDLTIIAASGSFTTAFQIDPDRVRGRKLFELAGGEWDAPQLRTLLDATCRGDAEIEAYELDLTSPRRETRH